MSKSPRIIISERAEADLDDIGDYIAAQAGEERAEAVLRTFARKIRLYATQPNAGRKRDILKEGMRSFAVYRYAVFYRPIADGIRVIRILHGSRDLEAQDYTDEGDEEA
jgi:toxin ParE1/3/4